MKETCIITHNNMILFDLESLVTDTPFQPLLDPGQSQSLPASTTIRA